MGLTAGRSEGANRDRPAGRGGGGAGGGREREETPCARPRGGGSVAQSAGFMGTSVWGVDSWRRILEGFYYLEFVSANRFTSVYCFLLLKKKLGL